MGLAEIFRRDDPSEENPVLEAMKRDLVWPPAQPRLDDETMVWIERVDAMRAGTLAADLVLTSDRARDLFADHAHTIDALQAELAAPEPAAPRRALPATAAIQVASAAQDVETALRPLPQRPTEAQRLGIEVHSWIEELHRGLIGLAEEDAIDEASLLPDRKTVDALKENFRAMGFEARAPLELPGGEPATEVPFTLKLSGGVIVRGRIDAVYPKDASVEIVDFKTGMPLGDTDWRQLELYAEALSELGLARGEVTLTFAYLKVGQTRSEQYTPRGLGWLEEGLTSLAGAR
jgi:ATP-dependent exoDNAse (exonuclease V) beta subunit